MKKKKAQEVKQSSQELNKQINAQEAELADVATRLLSEGNITSQDIEQLGQCIAEQQGYDKQQLVVCNITQLSESINSCLTFVGFNFESKPIFISCEITPNFWGIFCITTLSDKTVCLYKDFVNTQIPENIKSTLIQQFGKDIEFKCSKKEELDISNDFSLLSLKTLEVMMANLKIEHKQDFIKDFTAHKKTLFSYFKEGAANIKKELFSLVSEGYYKTIASDVDQLSIDTKFKTAIKDFINNIPLQQIDDFKAYQNLLQDIAQKGEESEIDFETIRVLEALKEKAFSRVQNLDTKLSTIKQDQANSVKFDIQDKFPTQMAKFTKIFTPLAKAKIDEKLEEKLKIVSEKLGIEYDKLRKFFKAQEETKGNIDEVEDGFTNFIYKPNKTLSKISNTPSEKGNKSLDELLTELEVPDETTKELLKQNYYQVKKIYDIWEDKDSQAVYDWALSAKGKLDDAHINEAIAVMDRANQLITGGHRLRDTQILSALIFLQPKDSGQLCQIHTGEGKTTIVSLLAAIKSLQGQVVDIVTSNPVLAADGVKDKAEFYQVLNLTVATNNLDENYKRGPRECYKADIVYGSISNFQFDYLKDSFLGYKTRGDREFGEIILDEVDSMIIDNASHIAKLSGPLPGMESLKYIYIKIWQELHKAESKLVKEISGKLKNKAQELESRNLSDDRAQQLYEEYQQELLGSIEREIKNHIKQTNPTNIDLIPSHIKEYADNSLDRWIDSAISAKFNYREDEQYIIKANKNGEEEVQPVDNLNTGITLKNTIWQHGLHQFLQLKHNLHLTAESLTSCFISNLGYINKYSNGIFGLTGTLGSDAEQELLSSVYNVNFARIPTYKKKKFIEQSGQVVQDEALSQAVSEDALSKLEEGRSSLIICETIKEAKQTLQQLQNITNGVNIKTFFDEENAHITEQVIGAEEIVIATNIAGRGTDFKTSVELEENGGLHVCVSFLPCNKRVEDQAFGRTARQGKNGTAKLIVKKSEIEKLGLAINDQLVENDFNEIRYQRDLQERERIKQIQDYKIDELKFQDELFSFFSDLYKSLKKNAQTQGKHEHQYVLEDLKEYWAFWLEKKNFKGHELKGRNPTSEFKAFKKEAQEVIEGKITFNPYYSIQQAEYFISNDKLDKAEEALNNAVSISKNNEILHSAYIKLAEIAIEKGSVLIDKFKQAVGKLFFIEAIEPDREYKKKAISHFKKAREAFEKELRHIDKFSDDPEFGSIIVSNGSKGGIDKKADNYWYNDTDIDLLGRNLLSRHNTDIQFKNRLTQDLIKTFCNDHKLETDLPVFICYNIGGKSNQNSGIHWVSICIIKTIEEIKIFYKDSLGNYNKNSTIVKGEFAKYYPNFKFIQHDGIEQSDSFSCGLLAVKNLHVMSEYIQSYGVNKFVEDFTEIKFCKQDDVPQLKNDFANILGNTSTESAENLFIKHLYSRKHALNLGMHQVDSLIEQVERDEGGIAIQSRISNYFSKSNHPIGSAEEEIKKKITNSELTELAAVGTNTTYSLRTVHDVCSEVVQGAQVQIAGGLALLATGAVFPPALPVTGAIGGTMITEGLCDIAIELISKGNGQFDKSAYIKGKVISYGTSLLTMGISALLQCPKILNAAKKACRGISETLRKCKYLKDTCEYLATKFDKLGNWFEKLETISKFNNMTKAEKLCYLQDLEKTKDITKLNHLGNEVSQLSALAKELESVGKLIDPTHFEKCAATFKSVAISAAKGAGQRVIENQIMSKVVTPTLSSLMSGLEPVIRKHIAEAIKSIDKKKLRSNTSDEIMNAIRDIRNSIDSETVRDIFKDAILGMTKYANNWKIQLGSLLIDQAISWEKVYSYTQDLCKKLDSRLKTGDIIINQDKEVEKIIEVLIGQFSQEIYGQVVSNTIRTTKDIYSVGKSAYGNYKKEKQEEAKCLKINESFKRGGEAGQEQMYAMSDQLKRPIEIYDENGRLVKVIGDQYINGTPVKVSHYPPSKDNPKGHYVPYGQKEDWSLSKEAGIDKDNNCLFDAIAWQTGDDPAELRQKTIEQIQLDPTHYIAHHMHEVGGFDDVFMRGAGINNELKRITL